MKVHLRPKDIVRVSGQGKELIIEGLSKKFTYIFDSDKSALLWD